MNQKNRRDQSTKTNKKNSWLYKLNRLKAKYYKLSSKVLHPTADNTSNPARVANRTNPGDWLSFCTN